MCERERPVCRNEGVLRRYCNGYYKCLFRGNQTVTQPSLDRMHEKLSTVMLHKEYTKPDQNLPPFNEWHFSLSIPFESEMEISLDVN